MNALTAFDKVSSSIIAFIAASEVVYRNLSGGGFVVIGAQYHWAPLVPERQVEQVRIRRAYNRWFTSFEPFMTELPSSVRSDVLEADQFIRLWIEQHAVLGNEPEPSSEKNRGLISQQLNVIREAVLLLRNAGIRLKKSSGESKSQLPSNQSGRATGTHRSHLHDDSPPPKAFISYAWESEVHKAWVRDFAARLRADGVEVHLDRWHLAHGDQLTEFMEREVRENDFVLIVCTPKYRERSDLRTGGVGYEGDIITSEVYTKRNHRKFIPILRLGTWEEAAPSWMRGKVYVDLEGNPYEKSSYQALLATLHSAQESAPPVGKRPNFPV